MKKRLPILSLLLLCFLLHCKSAAVNSLQDPVYQNGTFIGTIDAETDQQCDRCYSIKPITIDGALFTFKIPVSINLVSGATIFQEDYQLTAHPENQGWILNYRNIYNSEIYYFNLNKIKGQFHFTKITKTYSAVKTIQTGPGDYADFTATAVCIDDFDYLLSTKKPIDLETYFVNEEKTCTYCPARYSVEECLEIRKKGKEVVWE